MLTSLQSVFTVLLIIAAGFGLAKAHWFEGNSSALISKLVINLALPAYMVSNFMSGYDKEKLLSMLPGLPVPFAVILLSYLLAMALSVLFRIPKTRIGVFNGMIAFSNAVFIGVPVNIMLFGDSSVPYALLYYIANTTLFWTIGVYGIAKDASLLHGTPKPSLISLSGLKRILSPPIIAFLSAIVLILLGIQLPKSILDSLKYLGNMTTPLSLLFIGIIIARVDWKRFVLNRDYILVLLGRFVVSPLLMLGLVSMLDLPIMMKQVFILDSALPGLAQNTILSEAYHADSEYAAVGTSLTTVLSIVVIPLCMSLIRSMPQ